MQRLLLLPLLLATLNFRSSDASCSSQNATHAICTDLEDLKLIHADLTTLSAPLLNHTLNSDYFTNQTNLRHLDLSGGSIQQIEPGTFNKLSNLHSLNLAENAIEYLELGSLDGLNHLHTLNIRKNKLEQLPPALARLKILKHLEIHGNPLQCNCATLRVRDLLSKRGVKFSGKKITCSGPRNLKGSSLFKLDSLTICNFEQQDREMQNDAEDFGSGDVSTEEFLVSSTESSFSSSTSEVPEVLDRSTNVEPEISTESTDATSKIAEKEEEIFLDLEQFPRKKEFKDALYYPVEGSGEEEGSGEGSGTGISSLPTFRDFTAKEEDSSSSGGFFQSLFDFFGTESSSSSTESSIVEEPNLVDEEFIDVSSPKEDEEEIVPVKASESNETPSSSNESSTKTTTLSTLISNGAEIGKDELQDKEKLGKMQEKKVEEDEENSSPAPSSTKQSKKGMGSYVVLAALLAILATLIGFAAYKGDFCKKKRKRGDPETGTEMKDMQKALLETGNSHQQPKIASNGNVETSPLFGDSTDHCEAKVTAELPKASNGNAEKGESKRGSTYKENEEEFAKNDSLSCRTGLETVVNNSSIDRLAEANGPPLSPGAQRVKITLQENPDSVPRTPILITRTMAGDNLVKLP